jgi:hypothetical protein
MKREAPPNSATSNRRPAGQLDGSGNLSAIVAADRRKAALRPRRSTRAFPAAVAELLIVSLG